MAKRSAWKSAISNACDVIEFTIVRLLLLALLMIGAWTIVKGYFR